MFPDRALKVRSWAGQPPRRRRRRDAARPERPQQARLQGPAAGQHPRRAGRGADRASTTSPTSASGRPPGTTSPSRASSARACGCSSPGRAATPRSPRRSSWTSPGSPALRWSAGESRRPGRARACSSRTRSAPPSTSWRRSSPPAARPASRPLGRALPRRRSRGVRPSRRTPADLAELRPPAGRPQRPRRRARRCRASGRDATCGAPRCSSPRPRCSTSAGHGAQRLADRDIDAVERPGRPIPSGRVRAATVRGSRSRRPRAALMPRPPPTATPALRTSPGRWRGRLGCDLPLKDARRVGGRVQLHRLDVRDQAGRIVASALPAAPSSPRASPS